MFDRKTYEERRCILRKEKRKLATSSLVRECKFCHSKFSTGAHKLSAYCSGECRHNSLRSRAKESNDRRKKSRKIYKYNQYEQIKSDPIRYAKFLERARNRARIRNRENLAKITRTCPICSVHFKPNHGTTKYCSDACREKFKKDRAAQLRMTTEAKANRNKFLRNKRATDPIFKLRSTVSHFIWRALRRTKNTKHGSVAAFLPYSIPQLKAHIESFFNNANGFTWENHGKVWHLDHIIPQAMFHYTSMDSKAFRNCWALSNLMPSKILDNHSKGARRIGTPDDSGQLVFLGI